MKITTKTAHFTLRLPIVVFSFFCIFLACSFASDIVPVVPWAVVPLRAGFWSDAAMASSFQLSSFAPCSVQLLCCNTWVEFGLVLWPRQPVLPPCSSQCQDSSWSPVTRTARVTLQGWSLTTALKRKERRKSHLVIPHTTDINITLHQKTRLLSYIPVPRHLPPKRLCLCYSGKPCTALVWMTALYRQHPSEQS